MYVIVMRTLCTDDAVHIGSRRSVRSVVRLCYVGNCRTLRILYWSHRDCILASSRCNFTSL